MTEDTEVPQDSEAVGNWLRELRTQAGLSQAAAGEAIGVDASEIRRWENKNAPGGVNLLRLLSAYGVKLTPQPPDEIPRAVNAELHALRNQMTHQIKAFNVDETLTIGEDDVRLIDNARDRTFFLACRDAISEGAWEDADRLWPIAKAAGLVADDPYLALRSAHRRYDDIVAWLQQRKTAEALSRMMMTGGVRGLQQGADELEGNHPADSRLEALREAVAEVQSILKDEVLVDLGDVRSRLERLEAARSPGGEPPMDQAQDGQ